MSKKKKVVKKTMTDLILSSSAHFAKELAITKRGKGGVFQDKRDKKKNAEKWKKDVKQYY